MLSSEAACSTHNHNHSCPALYSLNQPGFCSSAASLICCDSCSTALEAGSEQRNALKANQLPNAAFAELCTARFNRGHGRILQWQHRGCRGHRYAGIGRAAHLERGSFPAQSREPSRLFPAYLAAQWLRNRRYRWWAQQFGCLFLEHASTLANA